MHENLQKTVARLLGPLVRLLLRHGVSHAEFSNWAKQAFVDEAETHFGVKEGKKPTVSRISVVTGINRKEVKRIQELPAEVDTSTAKQNRATRVVTGWLQDTEFNDASGNPKALEYGEADSSFNVLVKRYSGDVPARAVLDELIRVGTVERSDNIIRMKQRGYVPHESEEAMLKILGDSGSDLLETIDHNIANKPEDARLQLSVVYDNLSAESVEEFKKLSSKKSMELLQDLDKMLSKKDRDLNPDLEGTGTYRAGLGLYLIEQQLDAGSGAGEKDDE